MAYTKRIIKDRVVEFPHRYKQTLVAGTSDTYDLAPVTGTVTEGGTVINKVYLQHIEDYLERTIDVDDTVDGGTF